MYPSRTGNPILTMLYSPQYQEEPTAFTGFKNALGFNKNTIAQKHTLQCLPFVFKFILNSQEF